MHFKYSPLMFAIIMAAASCVDQADQLSDAAAADAPMDASGLSTDATADAAVIASCAALSETSCDQTPGCFAFRCINSCRDLIFGGCQTAADADAGRFPSCPSGQICDAGAGDG